MAFLEEHFGEWKSLPRGVGIAWLVAFALFLLYARSSGPAFLFIDWANLMIHEAGHPFFSWFGSYTLTILGGTLGELIVPLLCALNGISISKSGSNSLNRPVIGQTAFVAPPRV